MRRLTLGLGMFCVSLCAAAHVTLEQQSAVAGSYYKATLRVSHGCDGSATRAVTVLLPDGFQGAKPMPKPGWQVSATLSPLAKPYVSHGKPVKEEVTTIAWQGGSLPAGHFDEFSLFGKLPANAGKIYFKILQECESGKNEWFATPDAGKSLRDYPQPAAELRLTKPDHAHHH